MFKTRDLSRHPAHVWNFLTEVDHDRLRGGVSLVVLRRIFRKCDVGASRESERNAKAQRQRSTHFIILPIENYAARISHASSP